MTTLWKELLTSEAGLLSVATLVGMTIVGVMAVLAVIRRNKPLQEQTSK